LALVLVPADFRMTAEGTLQPEVRRHVFARADGVVDQLMVDHGSRVRAGDDLVKLRSSEIDLQLIELQGELETTGKKLASTKAARVAASGAPNTDRARLNQLAAEEEELRFWLASLQHQQQLLVERKGDLRALSPIDGEVITWDVEDQLLARPVTRGEVLLTVAQTDGPWVLELLLPDKRVGHMRDAVQELGEELDVTFILATDPGQELQGTVQRVATSTIVDATEGLVLPITVAINEADVTHLRPGAKVVARIDCGRQPIGYVWLHELFEFFQSRVLFRL
jgi:multidrug efflux pump subunit AcrA (membrane-fusion protein)